MAGGTEGVLSPHLTIFTCQSPDPDDAPRFGLVLAISRAREFVLEEIRALAMVETVAAGVKAAIAQANLKSETVHFIQIKCPRSYLGILNLIFWGSAMLPHFPEKNCFFR